VAYENSALLSKAKDKRNSNSPDYYGQVTLTEDVIRYLAQQHKSNGTPSLRVAVWRKENDRGVYLSMSLSIPREGAASGGAPARPSRPPARQAASKYDERQSVDDDFNDEIPF